MKKVIGIILFCLVMFGCTYQYVGKEKTDTGVIEGLYLQKYGIGVNLEVIIYIKGTIKTWKLINYKDNLIGYSTIKYEDFYIKHKIGDKVLIKYREVFSETQLYNTAPSVSPNNLTPVNYDVVDIIDVKE